MLVALTSSVDLVVLYGMGVSCRAFSHSVLTNMGTVSGVGHMHSVFHRQMTLNWWSPTGGFVWKVMGIWCYDYYTSRSALVEMELKATSPLPSAGAYGLHCLLQLLWTLPPFPKHSGLNCEPKFPFRWVASVRCMVTVMRKMSDTLPIGNKASLNNDKRASMSSSMKSSTTRMQDHNCWTDGSYTVKLFSNSLISGSRVATLFPTLPGNV